MSDDNDKRKKEERKDDFDPYSFFKLSIDDEGEKKNKPPHKFPFWAMLLILVGILGVLNIMFSSRPDNLIDFSEFRKLIADGKIVKVELSDNYFVGYGQNAEPASASGMNRYLQSVFSSDAGRQDVYRTAGVLMQSFIDLLDEKGVEYKFVTRQNNYLLQLLLNFIIPFAFIFLMYWLIFRRMGGGIGGSMFGNGGGRAKAVDEGKVKTRFSDVAGVDDAKEELMEVVDFLKSPKKYTDIGGKIPKGVLLVGPPGTGKTLLARAVAGEAGVPFFRISGSDFVEMFVGVGASRVRDLFRAAREKAPCIIFIDEIDAVGKSRANSFVSNDEREQTLNQLLVEMDGFDNEKGLIVLAATNRADVLDPALLRPGRFDRQVPVESPDVQGREAILRIHAKKVKLDADVDFDSIAHGTVGFAGADLANVVNEAALLAVRSGRTKVSMTDFNDAIDKVSIGLKKKTRRENEKEQRVVAYHETGHALAGAFTPGYPPVNKITVVPRSHGVGGFTQYREVEETNVKTQTDLINEVDVCLGGRAAEEVVFGEISTGAANDIYRATDIVKSMITDYGMSERFKNVTFGKRGKGYGGPQEPELVREFSEDTQQYIDNEIARVIAGRYAHVVALMRQHRALLDYIAKLLVEKETIGAKEFEELVKAESHCNELTAEAGKTAAEPAAGTPAPSAETAPAEPVAAPEEAPAAEEESAKPVRRRRTAAAKSGDETAPKKRPGRKPRTSKEEK